MDFYVFHDIFLGILGILGALVSFGVYTNLSSKKREVIINIFFLAKKQTRKELKIIFLSFLIIYAGFILYTSGKIFGLNIVADLGKLLTEISAMLTVFVVARWWLRIRRVG
ncbi:MAG: hypothetical protein QW412_01170 [Candidatus Aenigmatarchaeota archaeon]